MRSFIILFSFVFFVSCAQVPKEASHVVSYQTKLQASQHWEEIAKNITQEVKLALKMQSESSGTAEEDKNKKEASIAPVAISDYDKSQFGSTIRTFLKTEFFNNGLVVTSKENSPYNLDWEVQINSHLAQRRNSNVGALEFVLLDIPQFIILGGNDLDTYKQHYEIIVTFVLKENETNLLRKSSIYYINDKDIGHYNNKAVGHYIHDETEPSKFTMVNELTKE